MLKSIKYSVFKDKSSKSRPILKSQLQKRLKSTYLLAKDKFYTSMADRMIVELGVDQECQCFNWLVDDGAIQFFGFLGSDSIISLPPFI